MSVSKRTQHIREQQADTSGGKPAFTVTWQPGYEPTPEDEAAIAELVEAAWKMFDKPAPKTAP